MKDLYSACSTDSLPVSNIWILFPCVFIVWLAEIISEPPNNRLSKFEGKMVLKDQTYSLDNEKILLRGCILRNTAWCYGVVIFAGRDTKLMMNSGKTKFKRTHIDRFMNFLIIGVSKVV